VEEDEGIEDDSLLVVLLERLVRCSRAMDLLLRWWMWCVGKSCRYGEGVCATETPDERRSEPPKSESIECCPPTLPSNHAATVALDI